MPPRASCSRSRGSTPRSGWSRCSTCCWDGVGAAALPTLIATLGAAPAALVATGGLLYTAGTVVYARKRPDPVGAVFGYHEVFHALVIAAAALQYAAIAFFVLPGARE